MSRFITADGQTTNTEPFSASLAMRSMPSSFSLSADLREPVEEEVLFQAVKEILPRFPFIQVKEKRSLFSTTYIHDPQGLQVIRLEDENRWANPLHPSTPLIIIYGKQRIGISAFSSLTDGHGALTILKTLLLSYFRITGSTIGSSDLVIEPGSAIDPAETDDAFTEHYRDGLPTEKLSGKAYHHLDNVLDYRTMAAITGKIDIEQMKSVIASYGTTVTEYLASTYLMALYRIQKKTSHIVTPIRLCIPVDLRRFYETKSLRNFSLFIRPEIHTGLGEYDLNEMIKHVFHSMRFELQKKHITSAIRTNFSHHLKTMHILHRFNRFRHGELYHSGTLSNMGHINLPGEMNRLIKGFRFSLGPNTINPENCGVIGFGKDLWVSFTRTVQDPMVAREFFRLLVDQGISVEVS